METKYSIDGGKTWLDAPNGIRLAFENVDVPGEDEPGHLAFNFTYEGLITDVWVTREELLDHNIASSSVEYADLMCNLIERDA